MLGEILLKMVSVLTPDDLKSAADILRPKLTEVLSGIAKGPPTIRVFEVYEPKA